MDVLRTSIASFFVGADLEHPYQVSEEDTVGELLVNMFLIVTLSHPTFLSQISSVHQKLHPCSFFSCKSELLAVKVALKEWGHRMEGAELPFTVWKGHKTLSTSFQNSG